MCVGYFLVLLDVSALNVALPSLPASEGLLPWVITAYAIPLAALLLAAGAIGDRFGHRRVVQTGLVGFGVGSVLCGVAPSGAALVGSRVVQGIGAALLLPGTLAVIARTYDGPARARAIAMWAAIGGAALPAGPLVGGVLVSALGWRAVFWLNVPVIAAALVLVPRVVPGDGGDPQQRIDLWGSAVVAVALGAAATGHPVGGLVAAAAVVALIVKPMPSLHVLTAPIPAASVAAGFVMNAGSQGILFLVTLLLQVHDGHSPVVAGLMMFPAFAMLVVVPPACGRLLQRYGAVHVAMAGLAVVAAGLGWLSLGAPLLGPLLLWGIGLGILTPAVVSGALQGVPRERAGLASAASNAARQAGNALGVPFCSSIAGSPVVAAGVHRAAATVAVACVVTAAGLGVVRRRQA